MALTILITRPHPSGQAFADRLRPRLPVGTVIEFSALMDIVYLTNDLPSLEDYEALIVTSGHGIIALKQAGLKGSALCYCVGDATTKLAREAGFEAVKAGNTAQELIETLRDQQPAGPLLYLRGRHVASDLLAGLDDAGVRVDETVVYDQVALPLSPSAQDLLRSRKHVIVPIFSARSARLFFEACPKKANVHIVAISRSVADLVPEHHKARVAIAQMPDAPSMAEAVLNVASRVIRLERGQ